MGVGSPGVPSPGVGVGSGWMPEEFAAASAAHIFPKRHKHVRETLEVLQGIWTNDLFEYHGEFADFERCGFGAKPVQKPHPPIYFSGLKDPKRSAKRIAKLKNVAAVYAWPLERTRETAAPIGIKWSSTKPRE